MSTNIIYGKHAVRTLIAVAPERVKTLHLSSSMEAEFRPIAQRLKIPVMSLEVRRLGREIEGAVHQGVAAEVSMEGLMRDYAQFMNAIKEPTPDMCLVLLNEVTDPHNVGAIIRSAAAFGAMAVLLPTHNQAPITGATAKASAGTVFTVPLVGINNENQTIIDLKKRGFWSYGLAGEGDKIASREKFDAPAVFVVGSEGEGLREKTREHCDFLLRIPMHENVESLNASVSAAIVLSNWSEQHQGALKG